MFGNKDKWLLFFGGALIKIDVNIGGRLALGEILMFILLPFALEKIGYLKRFKELSSILSFLMLWIVGSLFSDIFNQNEFEYLLKGVFRPITCITILIVCFALSYKRPKNLFYFFIGLFFSGIQNLLLPTDVRGGGTDAIGTYQYYAYTYTPFFLGLASFGSYLLYKRSILLASALCVVLGLIAFPIMSRTTASVLLLSGVLIYISNKTIITKRWQYKEISVAKLLFSIFFLYLMAFYPYTFFAGHGYLGERQKEKFEDQYYKSEFTQNPIGFLFSGRTETVGAMVRVTRSPIIGLGSWPKRGDSNIVALRIVGADISESSDILIDPNVRDIGHSVFFGMWSQSGIFVIPAFFLCFFYSLKLFKIVVAGGERDVLLITPYMLIFIFSFLFNNFNSTFRFEFMIFPLLYVYYRKNLLV